MTDPKALPVRVKPLVWEDFDGMGAKAKAMMIVSYLITKWEDGEFRIEISAPGYGSRFDGPHIHPTLEAAKAAAQADYEARIMSAIEVVDAAPKTLTLKQLADACMSYRHDYGLMTAEEREDMRREAADWWRCFEKTLNEPSPFLRAALTKGSTDDEQKQA